MIPGSGRCPGEGSGNPLQPSCLENPMDRGEPGRLQSTGPQSRTCDWHAPLRGRPRPFWGGGGSGGTAAWSLGTEQSTSLCRSHVCCGSKNRLCTFVYSFCLLEKCIFHWRQGPRGVCVPPRGPGGRVARIPTSHPGRPDPGPQGTEVSLWPLPHHGRHGVSFWQEGAPSKGLALNKRRGVGSLQACCPGAKQGHGWPDRLAGHLNCTADARRHLVPSPGFATVQPAPQACPPSKKGGLGQRLYRLSAHPFTASFPSVERASGGARLPRPLCMGALKEWGPGPGQPRWAPPAAPRMHSEC